ncbi:MAG: DNA alkylation repair protein [Dehalococcoidia bacterium]
MTTEHAHTTPSPAGKERRGRPRRAGAAPDNRPVAERVAMALETLAARADPAALAGMARYGIATARAYGVPMPVLRAMARDLGRDHDLALALWDTGAREARLLATMVDVPARVTVEQMERWVAAFDSWDLCDGCCGNLFVRTPHAWEMATTWSAREEEFVKRAGFVLMAALAVHDKRAPDEQFLLPRLHPARGG